MVTKPKLRLSFASGVKDRIAPLLDGRVQPEGIELIHTRTTMSDGAWRHLNFHEFQVHEFSVSSYMIAKAQGMDVIAIPVFPNRSFMHTEIVYHVDSGIQKPEDLVGKSLGIGEYQQTAVLWRRGILEHDFGVSQYKIDWWMERSEEMSHGGATGFVPPKGISFNRIPEDKSLSTMIVNHELDAASVILPWERNRHDGTWVDRSWRIKGVGDWSKVKPLFPDKRAEGIRFFKEHGFIPVNHTYVIRGDVYREHPWVALNLYNAFVQAKRISMETLDQRMPTDLVWGNDYIKMTRDDLGTDDPHPYGVKANEKLLNTMIDYSYEQGLTKKKWTIEELFAPITLNL